MMYILTSSFEKIPCYLSNKYKVVLSLQNIPIGSLVLLYSYGRILDESSVSKYHIFNVHNSLLPKYRGLHAFTWAIINNDKLLGYTLHKVDGGMDSGPIMSQVSFPLGVDEDINDAFRKGESVLENWLPLRLDELINGCYELRPQNERLATYVGRRNEEDARLFWSVPALQIHNFVRAQSRPYTPGAWTVVKGDKLYVLETEPWDTPKYLGIEGQVVGAVSERGFLVKCLDSLILIKKVFFKGKIYSGDKLPLKLGYRL